jgi:tetratricopeptide (TPR) repeat protein
MDDISLTTLLNLGLEEQVKTSRYDLQELISEGGMGSIYKAYDSQTDRFVAYKSIKEDLGFQFEMRFKYEAEVTASLEHPNIMPVYDIGQDENGCPYYTMKLLKGQTLADYLGTSKADHQSKDSFEIFMKICDAVSFAHRKNVIHRDLKPENIIIGDFGEVLVLDWGLAKILNEPSQFLENEALINLSSDLTQCGTIMGTPGFMAPEQIENADQADQKCDVFSLGCIFFNMLNLKAPFQGKGRDEILQKVKGTSVESFAKNVPPSARAVCRKSMSSKAEDRYQSVEELLIEVRKIQGGFTADAENPSLYRVLLATFKRHKAVSCLSLCLALFVIFGSVVYCYRIKEERNIADSQKKIAEEALVNLKEASPVYLDRAKHSIEIGRFDDALIDIRTYLTLNHNSREAYYLLGRINQGQMKYKEAAKAFTKAQELNKGKSLALCASALQISKNAWAVSSIDGKPRPDDQLSVYMSLVNNMQLPEAAALLDHILKDRKYSVQVYRALFDKSGLKGRLQFSKSGMIDFYLDKENKDISALRYFSKAFIGTLSLKGMAVSNLAVLKNLNIHHLDISGTRVARIPFLKGSGIKVLDAAGSRIQSLDDFSGVYLSRLDLSQCPIADLTKLSTFGVQELNLSGSPATNPKILKDLFSRYKKITLPKKWQASFTDLPKSLLVQWSDLESPILR